MSNTPISKCYSLRLNHCLNISINKFSQSSMIRFMYSNVTWILTAIYTQAEKFLQCHWVTKRKEKKVTALTLLSQKKQKEKIWWWPFLGKSKPKEAGGLKFGNLSVMFFFFIINFNSYPTLFFMLWPIPTKNQVNINISPNTWASKPMSFCPSIWHICLHWVLWG